MNSSDLGTIGLDGKRHPVVTTLVFNVHGGLLARGNSMFRQNNPIHYQGRIKK